MIAATALYGVFLATPPTQDERRVRMEECRKRYAVARTWQDTLSVDAHQLPRRGWRLATFTTCGDYRVTGMR